MRGTESHSAWLDHRVVGIKGAGKISRDQSRWLSNAFKNSSCILCIYICFHFFGSCCIMRDLSFQPGIELCPLHWKNGVLTTGPLGKSKKNFFDCILKAVRRHWSVQLKERLVLKFKLPWLLCGEWLERTSFQA